VSNRREISWCITLKNRCLPKWKHKTTGEVITLSLLNNCLTSLLNLQHENEYWEICISDWESTDVPCIKEYLNESLPPSKGSIDLKVKTISAPGFSRGAGLNAAFDLSVCNTLFFLDADMLFTARQVIDNIYKHTEAGKVYFPICISYNDKKHERSWKRHTGAGNMGISKKTFLTKSGGWQEKYKWGGEDSNILKFFKDKKIRDCPGTFFHQWHPPVTVQRSGFTDVDIEDNKLWELIL
jgi:hypothetical protein